MVCIGKIALGKYQIQVNEEIYVYIIHVGKSTEKSLEKESPILQQKRELLGDGDAGGGGLGGSSYI